MTSYDSCDEELLKKDDPASKLVIEIRVSNLVNSFYENKILQKECQERLDELERLVKKEKQNSSKLFYKNENISNRIMTLSRGEKDKLSALSKVLFKATSSL